MQVFRYSEPDFNPYGDSDRESKDKPLLDEGFWVAPSATGPVTSTLSLPGSKSLTNRELVLSALASDPSLLRLPLHSRDSALMIDALRALGVTIEERDNGEPYGPDLLVTPGELTGGTSIECGLAGTVMRFLPPVAALATGPVTFDGDEAARRRPMRTTIESLRALGVDVSDDGRGTLPFSLYGTGRIDRSEVSIDASASSQFVSGLLLSAPRFDAGITLRHTGEKLPSLPHIEMTIDALASRGVAVESPEPGVWIVPATPISGRDVTIEPDLSNAAPFLVAALVAGGRVSIRHWPTETTQVGADLEELLPLWGATVTRDGDTLTIDGGSGLIGGGSLPGIDLDLSRGGELAPALVALAALASGPSTITGIGHLRGHETDRLAALVTEINGLGGNATELDDGIHLEPSPLHSGQWKTYGDHRMAHAAAIIGLAVPNVEVDDVRVVSKTLPQFVDLWVELLGRKVDVTPADTSLLGFL
ncbi:MULTISPECIES: 3-phosphoshikimate 1-carboxyvinyltransferase [unclassified Frondihabitans]|uniref:3-phosphoshikimate 1-carboxyvinyltransferase n=1 Tax=unclassified Frondihabitans TaxID=2626248 RepID=UPI000F4EE422|nr:MULTISPECIES: 3-phosphoshikimate 1-carboxyvinyltransferase [unclassified Frondihabitans]RPE74468.1 3-phosphoshikimate 1-carboxyvinyltransferase [Frondihabitans sp. PhB153]RPF02897.1 3-phosphoshikimate 1-carboxyvinyltransferase [Frondihabitans sp. PhB161]